MLEGLQVCPRQFKEIIIHSKQPGAKLQEIVRLAEGSGVAISFAAEETVHGRQNRHSGDFQCQGVTARIKSFAFMSLADLAKKIKGTAAPSMLLALDSIQDPQNLGAIIRSGLAAGVSGVIIPKDRSASLSGSVAKASAGAVFHVDVCRVTNLVIALQELKRYGVWIFGAEKDGGRSIYESDFSLPACLVIGSEGRGMRPLVREQCDFLVSIPMAGGLDSLNGSVAAAVILFEAVRQRRS